MDAKEKANIDEKNDAESENQPALQYIQLFRYADNLDYFYMFCGTIGAIVNGASLPVFFLFLSGLLDSFGKYGATDPKKAIDEVNKYALYFVYVALIALAAAYAEVSFWMLTGERQSSRVRAIYLRSILRQDVGFFDTQSSTSEVVGRVSADTMLFQDAIGEKVGNFIHNIATFVAGFAVGYAQVWQIAGAMTLFIPIISIPGILYARALTGFSAKESAIYADAGSIAEQSISAVRTVYSFVGEAKTLHNYSTALDRSFKNGLKQGFAKGMALGANGLLFCLWSFLFWLGGELVVKGKTSGGEVLGTAFAVIIGGIALGQAMPNMKAFSTGRTVGYRIFEMIERIPPIDSDDPNGRVLPKLIGNIELRNVTFAYPSRPDVMLFNDFSLSVPAGKTAALVGSSGSGKSTVIALLERFYDPINGEVLIDGVNIKSLRLKWLRLQIGLVSQEPALFATSIKENIRYGKEDASDKEIKAAAEAANAFNFINDLPDKFDTQVGERGIQMSGGQKQRIAIARAILKNPPILLLDEATSALDSESEKIVQDALDSASVGRTTIVVAHRLSTIRNADIIAVIQAGVIVEQGTHNDLVSVPGGAYNSLINLQEKRSHDHQDDHDKHNQIDLRKSIDKSISMQMSGLSVHSDKDGFEDGVSIPKPSFFRLLMLNASEWKEALVGTIAGILVGFVNPFWAFIVAYVINVYFSSDDDYVRREVRKYAFVFLGFGVGSFLVNIIFHYFYGAVGEHLTRRVRQMMLGKMLEQEVGWFDQDENGSGVLSSKLGSDATLVRALVGDRLSLMVQALSGVGLTIILSLVLLWKLSLVMLVTLPLMMLSFLVQNWMLKGFSAQTAKAQENASQVAAEAVSQHRTVTAFSSQDKILALFNKKLEGPQKASVFRSQISGIGLGLSVFILYTSWGLALWYGAQLADKDGASFKEVLQVFLIIVSVGFGLAEAASLAPDFARGGEAVISVFSIIDRLTAIPPDDPEGIKPEKIQGHIEVRNVKFAYPARPDIIIFDDFSIKINAGATVALVGQSGSGKSTIIGLVERFYDPLQGRVLIDGKDIKKYNLRALRHFIGLVQQEPVLFATSIRENITYGKENFLESEIENAAMAANAHNFISGLPEGYNTFCGERGTQLSGGQKQRIAIARAVLKNPAILLLDEATSALDAESEKVVQDALDKLMVGRTTIVIAHRLSTIRNADMIAVLQLGKIVEQGNHQSLMSKGEGGAYHSLVKLQMHHA